MAPTPPPLTPAKLSSLSTSTLSLILELTRSTQNNLPVSPSLVSQITRNLSTLEKGIQALEDALISYSNGEGGSEREVVEGLWSQSERLRGLVVGLGVDCGTSERKVVTGKDKGKVGRLVDTGDSEDEEEGNEGSDVRLALLNNNKSRPNHTALNMPNSALEDERERERLMVEDEDTLRRANGEVVEMQKRMMNDQDDTLTSLSSAISRQHALSLQISSELEVHSSLLDETDEAVDRTSRNLRRASGTMSELVRKGKETGSTGLIVALVIVLIILVVVFKM